MKLDFYDEMIGLAKKCVKKKPIVLAGDFNVCHTEIDIARPEENKNSIGFLPVEREKLDRLKALGAVDSFRHVHGDIPHHYSWWSPRGGARARNVGWRIDYLWLLGAAEKCIAGAGIYSENTMSDHAPVWAEFSL